jgi:DUF2892 family protein
MNGLFQKNQSGVERGLRLTLGVVLLYLASVGYWWGLLGVVPIFTGAVGWCPLYRLFGISTCRTASP